MGRAVMEKMYRFGSFTLDESARILRRDGNPVALPPKSLLALLALVQAEGGVISKPDLLKKVWPDTYVEENALAQVVWALRKQLAAEGAGENAIETVTRVGYRFRLPVIIDAVEHTQADHARNGAPHVVEARPSATPPDIRPVAAWHDARWIKPLASAIATAMILFALTLLHSKGLPWRASIPWTLAQVTTNDSDHAVGATAISPDGQWLAYTDPTGPYLREMRTGRTRPLKGPSIHALKLMWFRDEKRLLLTGYEHDDPRPEIWVLSAVGGDARLFRHDAGDGAPSPDGRSIAFTIDRGQAIQLANVDGTGERTVAIGNADRVFSALFWPSTGKRISYQQRSLSGSPGTEVESNYNWSYRSLNLRSLLETASIDGVPFDSAAETASGRLYFLRSHPVKETTHNGLWTVITDPATGAFKGAPKRLAALNEELTEGLSITGDGKQVAVVQQHLQPDIYVADLLKTGPSLQNIRRLTSTLSNDFPYSWNKGDDTVYFESNRVGSIYHIFRQRLDSSNSEMLTFGDKQQFFPTLMPDGTTLLYEQWAIANGQKQRSIYRANTDGTNARLVWKENNLDEWRCPLLSGSHCVLRETEGQRMFVFYGLDLTTGKGQELARSAWEPTFLGDWALSPDGATAAIPNHDPQAPSIRFVPLDGSGSEHEIKLHETALLSEIHWSTDAQGFYVEAQIGIHNQLQFISLQGESQVLREATGNTWGLPSRNGRKLAFADSTISRNVFLWQ